VPEFHPLSQLKKGKKNTKAPKKFAFADQRLAWLQTLRSQVPSLFSIRY
jgi:hypothetical protein